MIMRYFIIIIVCLNLFLKLKAERNIFNYYYDAGNNILTVNIRNMSKTDIIYDDYFFYNPSVCHTDKIYSFIIIKPNDKFSKKYFLGGDFNNSNSEIVELFGNYSKSENSLLISVKNNTSEAIKIDKISFLNTFFNIYYITEFNNTYKIVFPQQYPESIYDFFCVSPREANTHSRNLNNLFPELKDDIKNKNVYIFWNMRYQVTDSTFNKIHDEEWLFSSGLIRVLDHNKTAQEGLEKLQDDSMLK